MASVRLTSVEIENPVAKFNESFILNIEFECIEDLKDDLEWKLVYVGASATKENDQELDSLLVGPIPVGKNKFQFVAPPPDVSKIPKQEVLGATGILLTCSYNNQTFVQVGYYVNNEYVNEELKENPPPTPVLSDIQRNILHNKPRVTTFPIDWGTESSLQEKKKMEEELKKVETNESEVLQAEQDGLQGEDEEDDDEEENNDMEADNA